VILHISEMRVIMCVCVCARVFSNCKGGYTSRDLGEIGQVI